MDDFHLKDIVLYSGTKQSLFIFLSTSNATSTAVQKNLEIDIPNMTGRCVMKKIR